MADLTAIILTKDEEKNIKRCLTSMKGFAKRCLVVDSGSVDNTVALAKELGADVVVHPFENYSSQWNWGLNNCSVDTKWVLRLDADECFPEALCQKLESLLAEHAEDDVNGFILESNFYFMGKLIKHGGHKKRKIMIFRNGKGFIEQRRMDEHTVVPTGRLIELPDRFDHYDFKDLDHWISKMNWYATREMQDYFIEKEQAQDREAFGDEVLNGIRKKKFGFYYKLPPFIRCWLLFLYAYIFKLGFLDGKEGFVYHWMYQRWYRSLVDAKILEQTLFPKPFAETGALGRTDLEGAMRQADK